ncbi:T9SS type A sorting domain-containing protein [Flavobacterium sp. J27]|uniref:T9SS type A sorting domain-containing protein n=1 Tax=Flavobacterium sp. J27 TaxID=2060419 RepID=UPI001031FF81|nr:T9SS type A sorting domain-containing protein [Flavobacterium sp. J27]
MKNITFLLLLFTISSFAQPPINQPTNYTLCEYNNSNYALFDLTSKNTEILGALDPSLYAVSYYENSNDAQNGINAISNPTQYVAINVYQSVTVRVVENANPTNFAITYLQLVTYYAPTIMQSPNMTVFESPLDYIANFDLTQQISHLIGNQINLEVTFHESENDANNDLNPIANPTSYTNTSSPQTLYARIESLDTGCAVVANFDLIVDEEGIVNIPDANLKAKLLSASSANNIASNVNPLSTDTWNIFTAIDTNNDGEIQLSEAQEIVHLNIMGSIGANGGIQSLQGLEAFYNLGFFNCNYNQLTSVDVSIFPNLNQFYSTNGILSSINLSNCNNLQSLDISYNQLTSVDLSQCPNLSNLSVRNNSLTTLDLSNNDAITSIIAFTNNLTSFSLQNKNFMRTLLIGFNQLTSLELVNLPIMYRLQAQNNNLTEIDLSTIAYQIEPNNLPAANILDIYLNNNVNLNVINLKNGFANSNVELGSDNVSNMQQYICIDTSDNYTYFTTTDTPVVNTYCSFDPGGDYNTIAGVVQYDVDANGCDITDPVAPYIGFEVVRDGVTTNSSVFSNTIGNYSLFTSYAGVYSLNPNFENPSIFTVTPSPLEFNIPIIDNTVITQDICIAANGVFPDVEVVIAPIVPARPGFDATYQIVYKNKGNQTVSGDVTFTYDDSVLDLINTSVLPDVATIGQLTFNYTNLQPFENKSIYVTFNVNGPTESPAVNIGDNLYFTAVINPVVGDGIVADNSFDFNQTVVGSYDPNDITCIEGDVVSPSAIGDYLHYVINFENTGNAPAENIVVKTVINPSDYDIRTIQLLNASHNVNVRIDGDIIEFIFQAIYLDTGGHGNILLKLKTVESLIVTDIVTNKADIYFDYNAPIVTNDANTTFQTLSSSIINKDNTLGVYPNPTSNVINLKANTQIMGVDVFDAQGRIVMKKIANTAQLSVDVSHFQNGIYFLKVKTEQGEKVEKIIKE